jgi:hypothetical protein
MQGKFLRSYRKLAKNGQPVTVFVYAVDGTDAELAQFKDVQGEDNYRESDDGEPLWFTTRMAGDRPTLLFTAKGGVTADMSAFDKAHSLAEQYGGSLGAELAKQAAALLSGGNPPSAPEATPQVPADKSAEPSAKKGKPKKD